MSVETLTRLRFSASRLADWPIGSIRDIGRSMVSDIDAALKTERVPQPVTAVLPDLQQIPIGDLLGEIARRIRSASRAPKTCNNCGKNRCRAKGLCMRCYQRARKEQLKKRV